MAIVTKRGTIQLAGSGTTTVVSGLPFRPKLVIFLSSNVGITSEGYQSHETLSMGIATDGEGQGGIYGGHLNGSSASNGVQYTPVNTESVILGTGDGLNNRGSVAMNSDGFTITWNGTLSSTQLLHYIAIGGSDVQAHVDVGSWTGTGSKSTTGVPFTPETAIFLHCGNSDGTYFGTFSVGAAKSSTNRWCSACAGIGGASMSANNWEKRQQRTDSIILGMKSTTQVARVDFTSMDASGVTVNVVTNTHNAINYVILYLNTGGDVDIGAFNKAATLNGTNVITPSISHNVEAVMALTFGAAASTSITANDRMSIGWANSADGEALIWGGSNDAVSPSVAASRFIQGKIACVSTPASTTNAEADLAIGTTTATFTWTTNNLATEQVLWLAFGVGAAASTPVAITASSTGTMALARTVNLIDTFSSTVSFAAPIRTVNLIKTFSATGTMALVRSVLRSIAASATGALSLSAFRQFPRSITASATGTATQTKSVGKNVSASATGTNALVRTVGRILSFTGTGSMAPVRSVGRNMTFSGTGSASIAAFRQYQKLIAVSCLVTYDLVRSIGKNITASASVSLAITVLRILTRSLSFTGTGSMALVRSVGRNMAFSGTGTANVSALKVILKTIAATASGTFSWVRTVGKVMPASSTGTTTVATSRQYLRSITAGATGAYAVSRSVSLNRSFSATGTADVSALKAIAKLISATASGAVSLIRSIGKPMIINATGSADLITSRRLIKIISATATGSFAYLRAVGRSMAMTASCTASVVASKSVLVTILAASSVVFSMRRSVERSLSFSGSGTFSLSRVIGRVMIFPASGSALVNASRFTAVLIIAVATGSASLLRGFFRTISASGSGSASTLMTRALQRTIDAQAIGSFTYLRTISKTITATGLVNAIVSAFKGLLITPWFRTADINADWREAYVALEVREADAGLQERREFNVASEVREADIEIDIREMDA